MSLKCKPSTNRTTCSQKTCFKRSPLAQPVHKLSTDPKQFLILGQQPLKVKSTTVFNRPGVAGAVLQTHLSSINSLSP